MHCEHGSLYFYFSILVMREAAIARSERCCNDLKSEEEVEEEEEEEKERLWRWTLFMCIYVGQERRRWYLMSVILSSTAVAVALATLTATVPPLFYLISFDPPSAIVLAREVGR